MTVTDKELLDGLDLAMEILEDLDNCPLPKAAATIAAITAYLLFRGFPLEIFVEMVAKYQETSSTSLIGKVNSLDRGQA
jgi:hypothetical protein